MLKSLNEEARREEAQIILEKLPPDEELDVLALPVVKKIRSILTHKLSAEIRA